MCISTNIHVPYIMQVSKTSTPLLHTDEGKTSDELVAEELDDPPQYDTMFEAKQGTHLPII